MSISKLTGLLPFLTSAQLSILLRSIGAKTTGVKSDLVSRAAHELQKPWTGVSSQKERILSVDMGIRNLAFCVCDLHPTDSRKAKQTQRLPNDDSHPVNPGLLIDQTRPRLVVRQWRCMSLIEAESQEEEEPFHPSNLSRTALDLVLNTWLPYEPSTILIERQRFRTASAPRIQEWTLRVNTLESILHATLTALAHERRKEGRSAFPSVESIGPAKVASFWASTASIEDPSVIDVKTDIPRRGRSTSRSASTVKKEKMDLVKLWIRSPEKAPFDLAFSDEAERMRQYFLSGRKTRLSKDVSNMSEHVDKPSKLDDLADCLLQAAAWVQWKANRDLLTRANVTQQKDILPVLAQLISRGTE